MSCRIIRWILLALRIEDRIKSNYCVKPFAYISDKPQAKIGSYKILNPKRLSRSHVSPVRHLLRAPSMLYYREQCEREGQADMPTALRIGAYRFYFYSYDCGEPRHMHVDRDAYTLKIWLDPDIHLADNHGFSRREVRDIERIAREHRKELCDAWDRFCGTDESSENRTGPHQ